MAKDSNCKDRELRKRLEADSYMDCAVRECYASFKNIIKYLVEGEQEKKLVLGELPFAFYILPCTQPFL